MNRIVSVIGALLVAISPFLSFMIVSGISVSLWNMRSEDRSMVYVVLIVGIIALLIGAINKRWLNLVNILMGIIAIMFGIICFTAAKEKDATPSVGIWLMIIGGIAILAGAIMGLVRKKAA